MKRHIIKANTIYYLRQYWIDRYQDYKRIKIDKKKPIYGYDAYACGKKYCVDCGGWRWRNKNTEKKLSK